MGKSTRKKSKPHVYRGQSYDELMKRLSWLFKQAGMTGERRRELYRLARQWRRIHLDSTGHGELANQRTYESVEQELTDCERKSLKKRQARDRRNSGTYPKGRQIPAASLS